MAKNKSSAARKHQVIENVRWLTEQKRALDRAYEDGNKDGFYNCMTVMLYELRNVYGYGQTRMERLVEKIMDLTDSMDKGLVNVEDVRAQLREECGILLDWRRAKRIYEKTGEYPDWRNQKPEGGDSSE